MAEYTEDELFDLSDEELKAAVAEAKSNEGQDEEVFETEQEPAVEAEEKEEEPAENDLEQPEKDSDDNGEDVKVEDAKEEPSDESEQVETPEDTKTETEEPQEVQLRKFKASGKEYEFSDDEILERFPQVFGQAMDYTKKMQAIKPWRKQIDALEQNKVTPEQFNLMMDVFKGNKDAIAEVFKQTGLNALDIDTDEEANYVPQDYGRDESTLALEDTINSIKDDAQYEVTQRILGKDWDDESWNKMSENPEQIKLLHDDVVSGVYDQLAPKAEKLKLYDGHKKSDLEYYIQAAGIDRQEREQQFNAQAENTRAIEAQAEIERVKEAERKREATKNDAEKRKGAATTVSRAGTKTVTDYLDAEDDEAYNDWYKKLNN